MTYTILDLEWDSIYFEPKKKYVNQILQIGAVKLDKNFKIIDTFERTIRSSVSDEVSKRFTKLTGITTEDMLAGVPLAAAVMQYNSWIDEDTITMTWSNSDLYTVLENEKTLIKGVKFNINYYLDLQSCIQNEMKLLGYDIKSQISLSDAAEKLGITTEGYDMHTAKDDSLICAALLKKFFNKKRFYAAVKDTSQNNFFKRLSYKPTYIENISSKYIEKKELEFACDKCGKKAEQKAPWKYRNRWFFSVFYCENCKHTFSARICFRKEYDSVTVKKKVFEYKKPIASKKSGENTNGL